MPETKTNAKDAERVQEVTTTPLQQAQAIITRGTEWWVEATRPFFPGFSKVPSAKPLSLVAQLVDTSFDCAVGILEAQRGFAKAALGALEETQERPDGRGRPPGRSGVS
jgi:hypothetical protein